ncbi:MAG: GntR family transcriptional regulator [Phycisphaerales bacterium]|nr:GntR family transcriptional regulator [Phycisphaerales bacterium]
MATIFRKMTASRQLAQELRASIQQRKWLAGAQLPTVRQLANEYKVSVKTVHDSIQELVADELIECRPRQGAYVKAVSQWAEHAAAGTPRQIAVIRPISPGEDPRVDETQQTNLVIHGIELQLQQHELHPVLLSFDLMDEDPVPTLVKQIDRLRGQLAGVIAFAAGGIHNELFDALDSRGLPWVTINRLGNTVLENFVSGDSVECGDQIGQCLAIGGVKRALILGQRTPTDVDRIAGIIKGYWLHSQDLLSVEYLYLHDWRQGPASDAVLKYMENHRDFPQVLVCLGDMIAAGALHALKQLNIRVPDDISVISTTGLQISEYTSPPLTTYCCLIHEMGITAAQMLMEMLHTGIRRMKGRFVSNGNMLFRQSFQLHPSLRNRMRSSRIIPSNAASMPDVQLTIKELS